MSESTRKYNFDNLMLHLKDRMKLLPNLESKYMGLTLPFPQEKVLLNMIIESIKRLIEHDEDVCIAVHFNQSDDGAIQYNKIIFIGNDYLHFKRIINFMNRQHIKLDIKDTCILYRECTADLNINLKGNHSRITSLNDLFAGVEIHIDHLEAGMGYQYENKQVKEDIIHYCCHKDDEEGKELGYQLFVKSLDYFSKKLLAEGFVLGYPAVDSKIKIMRASCSMCFYRDYYYISGTHISLKIAMQEVDWQICEPLMQVHMTCNKLYFEGNSFFRGVENLCILQEEGFYKLSFRSRLSTIIDILEEMYNHEEDVSDFHMKLDSYVPVEDVTQLKEKFKMINNIDKWKDELEEQEMNSAIPPV
ncbi:elongation factor G [Paenibacillus ottowii]|uniref:elongation factor G n=1 Tax=Paenibacillus ottowii TaxID=2315729 RepID=UPI002730A7AB|nr:elongation factor G [Paenibacillus ottowii]MDP1510632.1 elongation factor G [Paenibacillus ottowii]